MSISSAVLYRSETMIVNIKCYSRSRITIIKLFCRNILQKSCTLSWLSKIIVKRVALLLDAGTRTVIMIIVKRVALLLDAGTHTVIMIIVKRVALLLDAGTHTVIMIIVKRVALLLDAGTHTVIIIFKM